MIFKLTQDSIDQSPPNKGLQETIPRTATKAILLEAGPEEGSEARSGRTKGRREVFWLGKPSNKKVEVAPSMARVEGAWNKEGLEVDEAEHLRRQEGGEWGTERDASACNTQPAALLGPSTGRGRGHWSRLPQGPPRLCPQPGAVSNSGRHSHLPLPCGNQSLLRKVSTNAPPASGVIDAGSRNISVGPLPPRWQGSDACHTNVPALVL